LSAVLQFCTLTAWRTPSNVHDGHGGDHGDAGQLVRRWRERDELTQIVCERHRERRGAAGVIARNRSTPGGKAGRGPNASRT